MGWKRKCSGEKVEVVVVVSILNSNLEIVACRGNRSILSTYTQLHLTHEEKRVDEVKK
jgi:hypothetical protein